jgi:chromosome segregation ATPase
LELLDFKENLSFAQNKIGSLEKQSEVEKKEIVVLKQDLLEKEECLRSSSNLLAKANTDLKELQAEIDLISDKYSQHQETLSELYKSSIQSKETSGLLAEAKSELVLSNQSLYICRKQFEELERKVKLLEVYIY